MEPLNPTPFLRSLVGRRVVVRSKWGGQYVGRLMSVDQHHNVQLQDCVELVGTDETEMAEIVIRCNNILYIRQVAGEGDAFVRHQAAAAPVASH